MRTWKLITTELRKLYIRATEAAIRIQCIFRLYFVKKRILNYYKFALSLRKAQALARRWILRRVFLWVLLRHKSAIKIQKLFRGQLERRRQTENKVMGIYSAALGNSFEKVKYFAVQFPELVYAITKEGNTMLHAAASGASKRILKYLLKLGLESNFRNYEGYTPLHFLIQSSAINRDECFDYMVEHGFDEEQGGPEGRTCLLMAAQYGRAHIAQQLLEYGADPSVPDDAGNTPLQVATSYSHNAVIAHLLEHNAEVNAPAAQGYYPLHYAVDSPEPVDTCNLLFDYGAEVNVYHSETFEYPIMSACSRGSADLVNLFLYRGADVACVDRNGWSIAHYAAAQMPCVTEMYSHLLTADTYFESRDNEGNTPMHIAAMYGNYLFMKCLVEGGVGVGAQNLQGNFCLIII
jgi:ankyrin repeat protein